METPLRVFLRTETGSAAILVVMTDATLVWINADPASCGTVWHTRLSLRLGSAGCAWSCASGRASAHLGIAAIGSVTTMFLSGTGYLGDVDR